MPILMTALLVLVPLLAIAAILRRKGKELKSRWLDFGTWFNAPLDNAMAAADRGINRDLIRNVRLKKVIGECSEGFSEKHHQELLHHLHELVTALPSTLRVFEETKRLFEEAARKPSILAPFHSKRLVADLIKVQSQGRADAAAEQPWPREMYDMAAFSELFENDEHFERALRRHNLLKLG